MMDKKAAEEDIIRFIDNALCTVGAFGYNTEQNYIKSQTMISRLTEYMEASDMTEKQCYKAEPLIAELVSVSNEEGFKRGFSVALRLMIAGLNEKQA